MKSTFLVLLTVLALVQGVQGTHLTHTLVVNNGSGDGEYFPGTGANVIADPPPPGKQFAVWTGDTFAVANVFSANTGVAITTSNVTITATYRAAVPIDKIRFYPRPGWSERMVGGVFEGSNGDPVDGPYTTIHMVTSSPAPGWTEVSVSPGEYRYLRYRGPDGSNGNVAEIEFYGDRIKLTGEGFGTPGSLANSGATFDKAIDGDTNTFFDAPTPDGNYVGIDTGTRVIVSGDEIRFHPRAGWSERMVGGVFEGTNGDPVNGPYTSIHRITTSPPPEWTTVGVSLASFRYLRYRGPDGSNGNVAEIEFYRHGREVRGGAFGTLGSSNNNGSTFDKALDGNTETFFDAPTPDGAYVGFDLDVPAGLEHLRYYPRPGFEESMRGGVFEGTNGDRETGPYTKISVSIGTSLPGWNKNTFWSAAGLSSFRYLRYRGPDNSHSVVAEIEFYRLIRSNPKSVTVKAVGTPFGTPGSLNNSGATFDKAFDGDTSTFFEAAIPSGAHTGIDIGSETPLLDYDLTVVSGTGSGRYLPGTSVTVSADPAPPGQQFAGWTGSTYILTDPSLATTTVKMPSFNVSISASYRPADTYTLTVNNGSGDGDYATGTIVTVNADPPPVGQQFKEWSGDITILSNPFLATTTALIPSMDVTVEATYSGAAGTGLLGLYYNDSSGAGYPLANPFTGQPVFEQIDPIVDFGWRGDSPAPAVNRDNFSAKWIGQVKAPVSGTYTFFVTGDDGVRLYFEGSKVIDGWKDQGATTYSYTTTLTAGTLYNIELHFYERGGDATCRLQWSYPGQPQQAIPQSQLFPPEQSQGQVAPPSFSLPPGSYESFAVEVAITSATPGAAIRYTTDGSTPTSSTGTLYSGPVLLSNTTTLKAVAFKTGREDSTITSGTYTVRVGVGAGLLGQYYNDSSGAGYPLANPFTGEPVFERTDPVVDFGWRGDSPAPAVNRDNFSAKWTGQVKAPVSGTYTFFVTGDDGVRFYFNGSKVIDGWKDQGATTYSYTTTLTAGTLYNIELHFYEHGGDATCRLQWSYPGQPAHVIREGQLFPPSG
ncbi:MAG TPA: PA14 domain-containing protein [Terrimicrobiaceae bacterium]